MSQKNPHYRWFVVGTFFFFMLLHQTDMLMIGSLQIPISEEFGIGNKEWGFINTGAMIVAALLYPLWGYLYDHYARAKLLALASFSWGATTCLNAIARTYPAFLFTRASTGIDDSSYPGLYTLISDYFGPTRRSSIYGLLQLTMPIGFLIGMILALMVAPLIGGWRSLFYITGALGLALAAVIYFGIKEPQRGKAEPEFESLTDAEMQTFKFSWKEARELFRNKTMWFVALQGFINNFPWNVITYFFFAYLMTERGYDEEAVLFTMGPVVILIAVGYYLGGVLGDAFFKKNVKGRIYVSSAGVLLSAIFFQLGMNTPIEARTQFFIFMCLTGIVVPFSTPNIVATVYDVVVPEVRSTAQSIEQFVETLGAALAPAVTGILAESIGLSGAISGACSAAWLLNFFLFFGVLFFIEKDMKTLRGQMAQRAQTA
jgi:MFS family permease